MHDSFRGLSASEGALFIEGLVGLMRLSTHRKNDRAETLGTKTLALLRAGGVPRS